MNKLLKFLGFIPRHEHKYTIRRPDGLYQCEFPRCNMCDDLDLEEDIKRMDRLLEERNKRHKEFLERMEKLESSQDESQLKLWVECLNKFHANNNSIAAIAEDFKITRKA